MHNEHQAPETLELSELLRIRRDKLSALRDSGRDPYAVTKFNRTSRAALARETYERDGAEFDVTLAGRIMSKRDMGKAFFCDLLDETGRIQLYVKIDDIGEDAFNEFKHWDIGDIIGVEGFVFRTRRGEISVHCKSLSLLSKSLRPLPEKFHGLKDGELRFRQRYVDLIVNPEVRRTFEIRAAVVRAVREYLDGAGYLEVETPVLQTVSGGAAARRFETHHNTLDIPMFLRIELELNLKRLIVGGLDRVYEIGRLFRNEGMDSTHNPEFTTVEFYEAYTDMYGMMERVEGIISSALNAAKLEPEITYQGEQISLAAPYQRVTMSESVRAHTGVDFDSLTDEEFAALRARYKDMPATWGLALAWMFEEFAERNLVQPTFVMRHPVEISPLAKRCADDSRLTERFELFIARREIANAFSELNDPIDQYERFARQAEQRASGDEESAAMDDDYVTALEFGLPPTGGCGIGIDRLVMLLTDSASIREVILFPTMKPL